MAKAGGADAEGAAQRRRRSGLTLAVASGTLIAGLGSVPAGASPAGDAEKQFEPQPAPAPPAAPESVPGGDVEGDAPGDGDTLAPGEADIPVGPDDGDHPDTPTPAPPAPAPAAPAPPPAAIPPPAPPAPAPQPVAPAPVVPQPAAPAPAPPASISPAPVVRRTPAATPVKERGRKAAAPVARRPAARAPTRVNAVRPVAAPPSSAPETVHTVRAGESLWSIATDALGAGASPARVAALVQRLWELNAGRIASGSPDMVRSGERLLLP